MKTKGAFGRLSALVLALLIVSMLPGAAIGAIPQLEEVTPIPPGPETALPDTIGAPAKPHPTANSGVPQNPLLAPNGFNSCHLDPWMSDTADVAGPLGRNPAVLSSTLAEARQPYPGDVDWLFACINTLVDSHGRAIAICFAPHEATVVLTDPDTLKVLDHYHLEVPEGDPYKQQGRQAFLRALGSVYSYVDAQDQLTIVNKGQQIVTLAERGTEDSPVFELVNKYNLTEVINGDTSDIAGVMLDWQGRIWLTTAGIGPYPAMVGVLNPGTYSDEEPNVKWYVLPDDGEAIRNTFALTKTGVDSAAAYVVTTRNMYRIEAGADDQPYQVWAAPYYGGDEVKNGQYELGSGTSPTIFGEGKYVAITDNASPMKVVVFRTDERLKKTEKRIVCEEPVFENTPGALSNSLVGLRNSLIASNNYDYWFDWKEGQMLERERAGLRTHRRRSEREGLHDGLDQLGSRDHHVAQAVDEDRADLHRRQGMGPPERRVCVLLDRARLPHGPDGLAEDGGHRRHVRQLLPGFGDRAERSPLRRRIRWVHVDQRHALILVTAGGPFNKRPVGPCKPDRSSRGRGAFSRSRSTRRRPAGRGIGSFLSAGLKSRSISCGS